MSENSAKASEPLYGNSVDARLNLSKWKSFIPKGDPVPAISIRQPWACAVTWLGKEIENRSNWPFKYRGPMLIHASAAKFYAEDLDEVIRLARQDGVEDDFLELLNPQNCSVDLLAQGAIVAVANLAHVFRSNEKLPDDHPAAGSPWGNDESEFWLYFDSIVPVKPVAQKGRVGLFYVPYDIAASLEPFPMDTPSGEGEVEPNSSN